jgi:hypothetical protein
MREDRTASCSAPVRSATPLATYLGGQGIAQAVVDVDGF